MEIPLEILSHILSNIIDPNDLINISLAAPVLNDAVHFAISHVDKCELQIGKATFLSSQHHSDYLVYYFPSLDGINNGTQSTYSFELLWSLYGQHITHFVLEVPEPKNPPIYVQTIIGWIDFVQASNFSITHLTIRPELFGVWIDYSTLDASVQMALSSWIVEASILFVRIYGFYNFALCPGYNRTLDIYVQPN